MFQFAITCCWLCMHASAPWHSKSICQFLDCSCNQIRSARFECNAYPTISSIWFVEWENDTTELICDAEHTLSVVVVNLNAYISSICFVRKWRKNVLKNWMAIDVYIQTYLVFFSDKLRTDQMTMAVAPMAAVAAAAVFVCNAVLSGDEWRCR